MDWDLPIIMGLGRVCVRSKLVKWVLMGKWVLYTQPNYAHSKSTHLTPLDEDEDEDEEDDLSSCSSADDFDAYIWGDA